MCRRPSQPRQPSDSQLCPGASAAGSAEVAPHNNPNAVWPTAAQQNEEATTTTTTPNTINPIVDTLSLADAVLLSRRAVANSSAATITPPVVSSSTISSQMTEEQRHEIRQMEWEKLHPIVGVLREDDDDGCGRISSSSTVDENGICQAAASRRRPRRTLRGPQGKRLSVEAHPLKLVEDLQSGVLSTGDDASSTTRVRRAGRRRVRRADSATTATKQ